MATLLSTELTNSAASPPVMNDSTTNAKLKVKFFSWTGDAAQNDVVQFCKIPKAARIIAGRVLTTALGASVTLAMGDGTTAAKYMAATDVSAISSTDFANTAALFGAGSQGELAAEITLTGTLAAANPAAGTIQGWVSYLLD